MHKINVNTSDKIINFIIKLISKCQRDYDKYLGFFHLTLLLNQCKSNNNNNFPDEASDS